PRTWTPASAVADEAEELIERAPAEGFARAHALGRALLLVRDRPDALVLLLDHASDDSATAAMRGSLSWLLDELIARDDGRLAWQQRRVAAEAQLAEERTGEPEASDRDEAEARRRRRFALSLREAGRLPRGPGLGRSTG
ncbi:MAG: hypothetical protein AB1Z98_21815, partial [Nannocystaceae bacterium]